MNYQSGILTDYNMSYLMLVLQLVALWMEIFWLFSWADLLFERKKSVAPGTEGEKENDRRGKLLPWLPAAAIFCLTAAVLWGQMAAVDDRTITWSQALGGGIFLAVAVFVAGGFLMTALWESKAAKAFSVAGLYCLALVVFWFVLLFVTASIYASQSGFAGSNYYPRIYSVKQWFGWTTWHVKPIACLLLTMLSLPGRIFLWTAFNRFAQERYRKHASYPASGRTGRFSAAICAAGYVGLSCLMFRYADSIQDLAMNLEWLINYAVIAVAALVPCAIFRWRTGRRNTRMIRAQNDLLMANYENISEIYTENAKFYHDMKHHLNMLSFLLEQGRSDEAAVYLQSLDVGSLVPLPKTYTGVEAADLILAETKRRADQRGIRLTLEACPLPLDMAIEKKDLTALLFNLTDNALAAAGQEICIRIRTEGWMFVLYMENDCGGQQDGQAEKVSARRGELARHGWGLLSVRSVVEKYHGDISYGKKNGRFCVELYMNV
ncbi:MAG: GHKL domain-containing protein [Lachnospiraceae bacterium]|nr:GHKL domain-containing protein [Lachnospiraceae bacterium]